MSISVPRVTAACVAMLSIMLPASAQTSELKHRFVEVNGIKMHIAEQGEGPLVVLVHGFPELWYSWRHIIPAVAAAGYHVVAPDMRGYGQTEAPAKVEDYTQLQFVGDIVALVKVLGYDQAVIAGHDWGSPVASNAAVLRPDIFRAVVLLSVPYGARGEGIIKPTEGMKLRVPPGMQFYQTYFQEPGVAEKEFDADPKRTMRTFLYSGSGSIPKEHKLPFIFPVGQKMLGTKDPGVLPKWLKQEELDYYTAEFARTGFRGGLNWYRNQDFFWQNTQFLLGRKMLQPTLFVGGTEDLVYEFARAGVDNLEKSVPNLWRKVLLPGVGHWTEQEAPEDVKKNFLEFLQHVEKVAPRTGR